MNHTRTAARWASALAFSSISFAAGVAAGEEIPTIHIVPMGPLEQTTKSDAVFDANIPASREFFLELAYPGDTAIQATVDVWPSAVTSGSCDAPPPKGVGRQHYTLGMTVKGANGDRKFSARVPPLQVGQVFCFDIKFKSALSKDRVIDVARSVAVNFHKKITGGSDCSTKSNEVTLGEDFREALIDQGLPTTGQYAQALKVALKQYAGAPRVSCGAYATALDNLSAIPAGRREIERVLVQRIAAIQALGLPGSVSAPLVLVKDKILPAGKDRFNLADELLTESSSPADLEDAANQLRARAGRSVAQGVLEKWAAKLTALSGQLRRATKPEDKTKAAKDVAASAKLISALSELEIANDAGDFVSLKTYQKNPSTIAAARVSEQLLKIASLPSTSAEARAILGSWITPLAELAESYTESNTAAAGYKTATQTVNQTSDAFRSQLIAAWSSEDVQNALLIEYQPISIGAKTGKGTTPDKGSYGSVDAGLLVAFPSGGSTATAWVVPYLGANLYFAAVDRTIPLHEMTGTPSMQFRQRVSLTAGVTLTAPSIDGRIVKPLILTRYPVFAAGFRVSQYLRVTAGAVLYQLGDKNPASTAASLRAAPFLGVSADIDFVHFLTSNNSFY
jgi:hypothetical protein